LNTQNALLQNPNNPLAHAVQGWLLGFKENYADAEIEIKKAIDLDPNNALAHAYYSEILINQGNFDLYERAATESKIAQDLDPTLMETHRIVVLCYSTPRTWNRRWDEFQAALTINKSIANLNFIWALPIKLSSSMNSPRKALLAAYCLES